IGIPGMFTFFNSSTLSNATETNRLLQKSLPSDKSVVLVTNFMHSPELPGANIQIESSQIKKCKFPYELQIEVSENHINVQFIAEEKNPISEEKSIKLFKNLDKLLELKSFDAIFQMNEIPKIQFDDFDF
ncbi:MAG: hypothetical protein FJZ67_09655, partial [Bacteroidetes bacterium]|nr:hypothetical protein [Bacteroidota bacterium]